MGAVRVTDRFKDLRGDSRRFTGTITGLNTEGTTSWDEGGNFTGDSTNYKISSLTFEKTATAPFTGYGVKPSSKTATGFTIETDSPPGTGETYTFTGIAIHN